MENSENKHMTGNIDNSNLWENIVDNETLNHYRKDCAKLKLDNIWGVIKIFVVILGILLGIPVICLMFMKGAPDAVRALMDGFFLPAVVIALMFVIAHLCSPSSTLIQDDSVVYSRLVPLMIRSLFGTETVYSRTRGLDSVQIKELNFYERIPEEIKGSDYISGVYKGIQFECGYENVEYTEKDGDGDRYTHSTFCGIMLVLPYRKISSSMIGLRGRTEQEIKNRKGMRLFGKRIERTDNEKFNRLFHIISPDDDNFYEILTPDMMEKLIALYEKLGGFSEKIHVCFREDMLYIGVPLGNYLRYKAVAPSVKNLEKIQQKLWNDLNVARAILDLALTL